MAVHVYGRLRRNRRPTASDDTEQRGRSRTVGHPRFRLEAHATAGRHLQ